jgi:hypothetical protein
MTQHKKFMNRSCTLLFFFIWNTVFKKEQFVTRHCPASVELLSTAANPSWKPQPRRSQAGSQLRQDDDDHSAAAVCIQLLGFAVLYFCASSLQQRRAEISIFIISHWWLQSVNIFNWWFQQSVKGFNFYHFSLMITIDLLCICCLYLQLKNLLFSLWLNSVLFPLSILLN